MASKKDVALPLRKALHGSGRAVVHAYGETAHFSELSFTYPLKLIAPRVMTSPGQEAAQRTSILYVLSYGGGLVGGDKIELDIHVEANTKLVALTQGSTKVFRARPESRLSNQQPGSDPRDTYNTSNQTIQRLSATIGQSAVLVLLPDPVTPFRDAAYSQAQSFILDPGTNGGSLVLLDWFTSGRMAIGEEWCFTRYRSINEVHIGTERVARDVLLLSQADPSPSVSATATATTTPLSSPPPPPPRTLRPRTLADKLSPYACYATLLLFGPATTALTAHFAGVYDGIRQMQVRSGSPEALLWSFSPLADGRGCIVRVAGTETERVKTWFKEQLRGLEEVVGRDAYARAFV